MSYTAPTAAELQALFPAFAAVETSTIDTWLLRAARIVDESWTEGDFGYGRMLVAAHYMTSVGLGTGAEATAAAAGASGFKSMRSGSLSLDRFDNVSSSAMGEFGTTQYGRMFWPLLRANRGGPRVTPTGTYPCEYPA